MINVKQSEVVFGSFGRVSSSTYRTGFLLPLDSDVIHQRNYLRMTVLSSYKLWRFSLFIYNSDIILLKIGIFAGHGRRHNRTVSVALSLLVGAMIQLRILEESRPNRKRKVKNCELSLEYG